MTDLKSPSHPSTAVSEASEQKSPQTMPLKRYAALCLLLLGVVFYASYGFANWLSAQRAPLPEIAFAWEQHIPFWAWTIVPYWSLNLFYACSVFVCKDRDELHGLIRQLLVAQAIAISCFMVFPLQFTWVKPPATGISGALFQALAGFDQPYNQAPSLHIILLIIIGHFYYSKFPKILRAVWLVWLGVIALSVLTTYQHHFIDIPTGVAVGALILWALPINSPPIWRASARSAARHTTFMRYYLLAAVALLGLACLGGWFLWLLWGALACLLVAINYGFLGAKGFQKNTDGRMRSAAFTVFAPYLLGVRINMAYWLRAVPKAVAITERVWVGSILAQADFDAVLDVCAEYPCTPTPAHYIFIPLLDMVTPNIDDVRHAADALQTQLNVSGKPVLVCCALGYSRSVAVVVTWLVRHQHCASLNDAIALVQAVRPQMVLSKPMFNLISQAVL